MKVKNHKKLKEWLKDKPRQFITVGAQLYCDCEIEKSKRVRWTDLHMVDLGVEAFYCLENGKRSHYFAYDPNLGDYEFVPHESYSLFVERARASNAA